MGKKQRRRGTARPAKGGRGGGSSRSSALVAAGGRGTSSSGGGAGSIDPLAASAKLLLKSSGDGDGIDLRGIISTNDDPFACALCPRPLLHKTDLSLKVRCILCCGKRICDVCWLRKSNQFITDLAGQIRCAMCKSEISSTYRLLRDQAHLGHPHAQFESAMQLELDGHPLRSATIWREKAAAQGHPFAFINLAESSRTGHGCQRDVGLARMYAERAKELHAAYAPLANAELATIAHVYLSKGSASIAKEIVDSLLRHQLDYKTNPAGEVPIDCVCCQRLLPLLEQLEYREDQIRMVQARNITLQIRHRIVSPVELAIRAADGGALVLANFFVRCIVLIKEHCVDEESSSKSKQSRMEIHRSLRELRRRCSGCGISLRGCPKKICNGCRTHSYCDRDCQKKHWNKSKRGHREECLDVQCLRELFGFEWK